MTIGTVWHVAHAQLLIAPIAVMCCMTSVDHWYCGARRMHVGATSIHNNDGPSDISGLLLLPATMVTCRLTSAGRPSMTIHTSDGLHDIK
jgi:hypothetical protein